MNKLQGLNNYLADRGISPSVITIRNSLLFPKRQIAKHDRVFQTAPFFVIPDLYNRHADTLEYLDAQGYPYLEGRMRNHQTAAPASDRIIIGGTELAYRPAEPKKIVALMHVYNEADILGETIRHLLHQGLHVHIIDNWSTDGSWEVAGAFSESPEPAGVSDQTVTRERFPREGPTEHYEWFRQLAHTEELAAHLPYDWLLHYDADEFRYSPWQGVSLRDAIGFVDSLGYNAIDFTVLDFRYTTDKDQVRSGFEAQNTGFEFGKRPGHFLQIKGWKRQPLPVDIKNSGGHEARFAGRTCYPFKFLTKHYSLRSREQAEKKLMADRLPRVQKELSERNWHQHIDLLIAQQARGWDRKDLIQWQDGQFEKDYLIERISGVGIVET